MCGKKGRLSFFTSAKNFAFFTLLNLFNSLVELRITENRGN